MKSVVGDQDRGMSVVQAINNVEPLIKARISEPLFLGIVKDTPNTMSETYLRRLIDNCVEATYVGKTQTIQTTFLSTGASGLNSQIPPSNRT